MAALKAMLVLAGLLAGCVPAVADEVCRYSGTTDYDGRLAVTSDVSTSAGLTRVDVTVRFQATTMLWFHIGYLAEEVSLWRGDVLQSVAVNNRQFLDGGIVRQQWDEFRRGPGGLLGRRVQAKTLDDFRSRHPGFVRHWDPATFGGPWLQDYAAASPERRPDLDFPGPALPADLRSPLALAFYWVRYLPRGGQDVTVFLPGFKADRVVRVPISAVPVAGGRAWQAPLRHPRFSRRPESTATAWTSTDGHLLRLAFDVHEPGGSARGVIRPEGCTGLPVVPSGWRR